MKKIIVIIPKGVVGKECLVRDNSYSKDLSNNCGHARLYGKKVILISEPYRKQVHEGFELEHLGENYQMMIKCIDPATGFIYEIMYAPEWIILKIN